jgi:MYXO-CTERM domain-containing protein
VAPGDAPALSGLGLIALAGALAVAVVIQLRR